MEQNASPSKQSVDDRLIKYGLISISGFVHRPGVCDFSCGSLSACADVAAYSHHMACLQISLTFFQFRKIIYNKIFLILFYIQSQNKKHKMQKLLHGSC